MRLTARQLNRSTLARQMLLRREPLSVVDAVRRVVALQAQEPPSPYLALWDRLDGFDPAELDRAFLDHRVVKASLMRITVHAVVADDYPTFHDAMQPSLRAARLEDPRFAVAGLSTAEADALIPHVVDFAATPRSNADIDAWMDERLGPPPRKGVWWAMRTYGPFVHAPTGGPWSFGPRPAYLGAHELRRAGDHDRSLSHLLRRYLEGFGPATISDLAQFARVYMPRARVALDHLADGLERHEGPDGIELLDVPGGVLPSEDVPAPPRLLPMWDSTLLAYVDRSRIIPPDYRRHVIRKNGDVLPTLLVDGYVAGVWRSHADSIEATAFHTLSDETWAGLAAEARSLRALLATRETAIYRRYHHWWPTLPTSEARRL